MFWIQSLRFRLQLIKWSQTIFQPRLILISARSVGCLIVCTVNEQQLQQLKLICHDAALIVLIGSRTQSPRRLSSLRNCAQRAALIIPRDDFQLKYLITACRDCECVDGRKVCVCQGLIALLQQGGGLLLSS